MSGPTFVFANTLNLDKVNNGSVLFKISSVTSVWFKQDTDNKSYVQMKYNDGTYQYLDMNETLFMKLVETIDKADLDA